MYSDPETLIPALTPHLLMAWVPSVAARIPRLARCGSLLGMSGRLRQGGVLVGRPIPIVGTVPLLLVPLVSLLLVRCPLRVPSLLVGCCLLLR